MIEFVCTCKNILRVEDDQAGASIQCADCGRLIDVPTLSELQAFAADGTYQLDYARPAKEPGRLGELHRAFSRQRVTEDGVEIDLRPGNRASSRIGVEPIPLESDVPAARPRPTVKYDPETGELIRPIQLQGDTAAAPLPVLPVAAPRPVQIDYVSGGAEPRAAGILVRLFEPANLIVIVFIYLGHVLLQGMAFVGAFGFLLVVPIFLAGVVAMLSHWVNVVETIGPEQHDELPRPLRELSISDDLWGPFVKLVFALGLSYGPGTLAALLVPEQVRWVVLALGVAAGSVLFPAALLVGATSGTVINLRPDRLMGTIGGLGNYYAVLVLFWMLAASVYTISVLGASASLAALFFYDLTGWQAIALHPMIQFPLLALGVYLMHAWCWLLGLQYRKHHARFPWALQRWSPEFSHRRDALRPASFRESSAARRQRLGQTELAKGTD